MKIKKECADIKNFYKYEHQKQCTKQIIGHPVKPCWIIKVEVELHCPGIHRVSLRWMDGRYFINPEGNLGLHACQLCSRPNGVCDVNCMPKCSVQPKQQASGSWMTYTISCRMCKFATYGCDANLELQIEINITCSVVFVKMTKEVPSRCSNSRVLFSRMHTVCTALTLEQQAYNEIQY